MEGHHLGLLSALAVLLLAGAATAAGPTVELDNGATIHGDFCEGGSAERYRGIPFAMPPVDGLRFAAPVMYNKAYPEEGLDATSYGSPCVQPGAGSEDCLTLNIWRPVESSASTLPVRVFIHGGGYQTGYSGDANLDGCAVVQDADVIYVTINYRLGVLGFLALPELRAPDNATGNWGLLDQRLALQWLQANIGAFGGDPEHVMLTGQSAGGYSALLHAVMPRSEGLFSTALPSSGSSDVMSVEFLGDAYAKGYRLREAMNCSEESAVQSGFAGTLECLREASAADLLAAQIALGPETVLQHMPCIDGVEIVKHPLTTMREGGMARIPVLLVTNAREGVLETGAALKFDIRELSADLLLSTVRTLLPIPKSFEQHVLGFYNNDYYGSWLNATIAVVTDAGYHCPARRVANLFTEQGLPARMAILQAVQPYSVCPMRDSLSIPGPLELAAFLGAFHGYDMPFSLLSPLHSECNYTSSERLLSPFMSGIYNAFAASGKPLPPLTRSQTSPALANITSWPTYPAVLSIDVAAPTFEGTTALLSAKCHLWDALLDYQVKSGTLYPLEGTPPPADRRGPPSRRMSSPPPRKRNPPPRKMNPPPAKRS